MLRNKGSLQKGVRIDKGKGILKVQTYEDIEGIVFPPDLDLRIPDHIIIATALTVRKNSNRRTIIISRDINMRVIADSVGLTSEDYTTEKVVTSSDELYAGFCTHLVDDQVIDRFYDEEQILISEDEVKEEWFPNQYLLLVSNANEKKTCIARFKSHHEPVEKIIHSTIPDWKISSRNKEQAFAIDLLMDPDIKVVSLVSR